MFGWLFNKKKIVTKVETEVAHEDKVVRNVYHEYVQARTKRDTIDRSKRSTYSSDPVVSYPAVDPVWDLTNPANPLYPLNPINLSYDDPSTPKSHSHGSSSSWSSHDHSSSSSYSSSDSSYDSGSPSYTSSD